MNTGFHRWWFVSSIFSVNPEGAMNVWPAIALRTSSTLTLPAFCAACAHMCMPT